jgi:hypothetical protein
MPAESSHCPTWTAALSRKVESEPSPLSNNQPPKAAFPVTRKKSAWLTLLIFIVVAEFNPEILSGSTKITAFFTPMNLPGLLFYGLQLAIIADLAARFQLKWSSIYLVGIVYGIFEEGLALMTMEEPSPTLFTGMVRIWGLNGNWSVFIAVLHSVLTVLALIIFVRIIWPSRVTARFLTARHYAVILPVIAVIYAISIQGALRTYVPGIEPFLILGGIIVLLILAIRLNQSHGTNVPKTRTGRRYAILVVSVSTCAWLLPVLVQKLVPPLGIAVILILSAIFFKLLFDALDSDSMVTSLKMMGIFTAIVGFWLIIGLPVRSPLTNVAALIVVPVEFYFGWRYARK